MFSLTELEFCQWRLKPTDTFIFEIVQMVFITLALIISL